ncbi:MAG: hypothetical protein Q7S28_03845 [bacterium]|nr:hypothetical protein [bacterium]
MTERKSIGRLVLAYFFGTVPLFTLLTAWMGVTIIQTLFLINAFDAWHSLPQGLIPALCKGLGYGLISGAGSAYVFQEGWRVLESKTLLIIGYGQVVLGVVIAFFVTWGNVLEARQAMICLVIAFIVGAFGIVSVLRGRYKQSKNL